MIIGCGGSGKSTLAKELQQILQFEVIHLDQYYWKPNWVESHKVEWKEIVNDLLKKDSWIMDGNYGGTMDLRIEHTDMIVFLDISTWKCLLRVLKRTFKFWGRKRDEMSEGCNERLDLIFIHYILTFKFRKIKRIIRKLNGLGSDKKIFILKDQKQKIEFLTYIKKMPLCN